MDIDKVWISLRFLGGLKKYLFPWDCILMQIKMFLNNEKF